MYDIFISFDRKYRKLAEDIYKILVEKYKMDVFIDYHISASGDTVDAIKNAIDNSRYMLILYSKEYIENTFCIEEFK